MCDFWKIRIFAPPENFLCDTSFQYYGCARLRLIRAWNSPRLSSGVPPEKAWILGWICGILSKIQYQRIRSNINDVILGGDPIFGPPGEKVVWTWLFDAMATFSRFSCAIISQTHEISFIWSLAHLLVTYFLYNYEIPTKCDTRGKINYHW